MVELSETFQLECDELDKDHQKLVDMVNEIVSILEGEQPLSCKEKVREFVNFAKAHFSREERLLSRMNYPDVAKHCKHHRQLGEKMEHMVEFTDSVGDNEMARESLKRELVFFVMDDVITTDLEFKSFIGDEAE